MLRTPLNSVHRSAGAKMAAFGGWDMPIQYAGIIKEHTATRTAAGLFDICHMGEFIVQGPRAEELLQKVTTNNVAKLVVGQCQYSLLCNDQGGVLDDLIVYRIDSEKYMLVVNAATQADDFAWIQKYATEGVTMENVSAQTAKLDIQGPASKDILKKVLAHSSAVDALKYFYFIETSLGGKEVLVSRTGYTGELGYEIYSTTREVESIWHELLHAGQNAGLVPCGLGARDTLRLEMGYSLYGHELDTGHTPLEAGLGWITKFDKGPFIGREALIAQKNKGLIKKIVAFKLEKKAVARHGATIFAQGKACGVVTSGSFGPSMGATIGLGFVDAHVADKIEIEIRNRMYAATCIKLPFYKEGTAKN